MLLLTLPLGDLITCTYDMRVHSEISKCSVFPEFIRGLKICPKCLVYCLSYSLKYMPVILSARFWSSQIIVLGSLYGNSKVRSVYGWYPNIHVQCTSMYTMQLYMYWFCTYVFIQLLYTYLYVPTCVGKEF